MKTLKTKILIVLILLLFSCENSNDIDIADKNYFPLHLNDIFEFNYRHIDHIWADKKITTGHSKWIVDDINTINDTNYYNINAEITGESIIIKPIYNTNRKDTTYSPFLSNYSFIISEINDTIFWGYHKFCRNDNDADDEYLKISDEDSFKLYLRKKYGIDYYYHRNAGGNSWDESELIRIY